LEDAQFAGYRRSLLEVLRTTGGLVTAGRKVQ
jgi:hypothetical protein